MRTPYTDTPSRTVVRLFVLVFIIYAIGVVMGYRTGVAAMEDARMEAKQ